MYEWDCTTHIYPSEFPGRTAGGGVFSALYWGVSEVLCLYLPLSRAQGLLVFGRRFWQLFHSMWQTSLSGDLLTHFYVGSKHWIAATGTVVGGSLSVPEHFSKGQMEPSCPLNVCEGVHGEVPTPLHGAEFVELNIFMAEHRMFCCPSSEKTFGCD